MSRIATTSLLMFVLASMSAAQTPLRVNVMPGFPNAPHLQPEETHMVRPGFNCVWGNVNGGFGALPAGATYTWSFASNQNLQINDDGDLSGSLTDVQDVCEIVEFVLLNNATRESVLATLTVDAGAGGIDASSVLIEVIDPTDPGLNDIVNQQIDTNIAIQDGLRSLYKVAIRSTLTSGEEVVNWDHTGTGNNDNAGSAFALWAFQNQGHLPRATGFEEDIYAEFVQAGLNWVFNKVVIDTAATATFHPRADVTLGAPAPQVTDINLNGQTIQIDTGSRRGYANPIILASIIASGSPDEVVPVGLAVGMTYREVAEDMIDSITHTMNQGGTTSWNGRGGWDYVPSYTDNRSDMSINSWAYVAMEGAIDVFGIDVPDWVKQEVEHTLVAHQAANGRFGYVGTSTNNSNNGLLATTGGGLSGLALIETASLYTPGAVITSTGAVGLDTIASKRSQGVAWIGSEWNRGNNSFGQSYGSGNRGNPYVMWTVARALRLTARSLGLPSGSNIILNLAGQDFDWESGELYDASLLPTGMLSPAGSSTEGYTSILLRSRNTGTPTVADPSYGSWTGWYGQHMTTALSVLVLTPRVFVENCPPIVNIPVVGLSPNATTPLAPGSQVILSGRAVSQDPTRPILSVMVNGTPVQSLDSSGNFFTPITVASGSNTFLIRATDRCGASDVLHSLDGGGTNYQFQNLQDVTHAASVTYQNTTFNQALNRLIVTAVAQNTSSDLLAAPLMMVFENFGDPSLSLVNPHGFTPAGKPYIAFTDPAIQQNLAPGATSAMQVLMFHNPQQVPVTFTHRFLAPGNQAPYFTSTPGVTAVANSSYDYQATAIDPDGDPVSYTLLQGPAGMSLNPTGNLQWVPSAADIGAHTMELKVSDGRGGSATQAFILTVHQSLANQAPMFTSIPIIQAPTGSAYAYTATATDGDGDPLTFSLLSGPTGLTVSPSGDVQWPFVTPGITPVTIRVDDGQGGFADQNWSIASGVSGSGLEAPTILSTPSGTAVVGQPYTYLPFAPTLPGGATVTWSLISNPTGMFISPSTGQVSWNPGTAQVGVHGVEIRATSSSGSYSSQGWTIEVLLTPPNAAPVFSSTPPFSATINSPYPYTALATDPEGDPVTYSLGVFPTGMSIDPMTGVVTWTPTTLTTEPVSIQATDGQGLTATQAFQVTVLPPNNPPTITSSPPLLASIGVPYLYQVTHTDPDPDTPTFSLTTAPMGMSIGTQSGLVTWTPAPGTIGSHPVTLSIDDGRGGTDTQSFSISVIQDTESPQLIITASNDPAAVGLPVTLCVQASDNVGVVNRTLSIDGTPAILDSFGCTTIVPAAPGILNLAATAEDAAGNVGTTTSMLVVDYLAPSAPHLTLISPAPGEIITCPTDVIASVEDPTGTIPAPTVNWTLKMVNSRTSDERIVETGNTYGTNVVLGMIDPTLLPNDGYELVLEASNTGFSSNKRSPISVTGSYKIGNFRYDEVDLSIPVAGLPISIARSYDSLDTGVGDFGHGWNLALNCRVSDVVKEAPVVEPMFHGSRVYVTGPDGMRRGFTLEASAQSWLFSWIVDISFKPDSPSAGELEIPGAGSMFLVPQTGELFTDLYITPLNPDLYVWTDERGVKWTVSEADGLQMAEDLNGNTLTLTAGGLVSSTGIAVTFDRDPMGRITKIHHPQDPGTTAPPPFIEYIYDASGNLAHVRDEMGNETDYFYENAAFPHYLTRMEDPLGRPLVRNVYDADGRLIAQCGPDGDPLTLANCTTFSTDLVNSVTTIFDARGNRVDLFADAMGHVTKERRWLDGTNFVDYNFTFDTDGNMLTEERMPGEIWVYTYDDRGNRLTETEPGGRTWVYTYNNCDQLMTSCDPVGNCRSFQYDIYCNLVSMTDPMGNTTTIGYDPFGRPNAFTLPAGGTWNMTYDARGFPASVTDPLGRTEFLVYDHKGQVISRTDRRGRTVAYGWNDAGHLTMESWDDGTVFTFMRNIVGEIEQATTPNHTLDYIYDNAGHLMTATSSGISVPTVTLSYGHDGNGNVTSVMDSMGGLTQYEYNPLNHLNSILQAVTPMSMLTDQGTSNQERRVDLTTNQAGLIQTIERFDDLAGTMGCARTTLSYDCDSCSRRLDRILHEVMASSTTINDIQISRDAASRITQIVDADGMHNYTIDGNGRMLGAAHPMGGTQPDEQYSYDGAGNRLTSHMSTTQTYSYATSTGGFQLEQDDHYTYAYDANGAIMQRTNTATGEVWHYDHDHRNRLVSITHEDSGGGILNVLTRTYDAANRLLTESLNGIDYHYGYDMENPILVMDSMGDVIRRRLYGRLTDQVFAESDSAGNHWLLTDQVGTVRDVVGAAGVMETHYVYDSFGQRLSGGFMNDRARLTFNSLEFTSIDGSGYYRARTYFPDIGRFGQADPRFPFGYDFVGNSPLNYADPSGQTALIEYACLAASAVSAACTIYSWLSPIGDIFIAIGNFLNDINSQPPDGPALVQAWLNSHLQFMLAGLPFVLGPAIVGPNCGGTALLTAAGVAANVAVGNPTPLPCQGVLY